LYLLHETETEASVNRDGIGGRREQFAGHAAGSIRANQEEA
jgi:hypothetical protein